MLRDCVWSRFGQLSTFQKDLSLAAGKKRSEDRNSCLWSGWPHLLLCFFFFFNVLYGMNIFKEKMNCAYGWCFGG